MRGVEERRERGKEREEEDIGSILRGGPKREKRPKREGKEGRLCEMEGSFSLCRSSSFAQHPIGGGKALRVEDRNRDRDECRKDAKGYSIFSL